MSANYRFLRLKRIPKRICNRRQNVNPQNSTSKKDKTGKTTAPFRTGRHNFPLNKFQTTGIRKAGLKARLFSYFILIISHTKLLHTRYARQILLNRSQRTGQAQLPEDDQNYSWWYGSLFRMVKAL